MKGCILYGSAARDQLRDHSDVDIAIGAGWPLTGEEHRNLQHAFSQALEREVDLVDLEGLTGLLGEKLWTEGLFLLKDHDLIVKYTGKVQAFVEDVKPAMMATIHHRLVKEFGPS